MKTDPKTGRNKPYAFLQFENKHSTLKAISEEQKIGGRNIDCELSCFDDNASKNDRYNKLRNTKQFVNHIKQEVTQSEFRKYFCQFGEIKQSYIVECPKTKKSKCFGFLRYYNVRDADKVLKHEHYLRGKLLIINRFEPQIEKNLKKEAEFANKHVDIREKKHFDKKEFDYVKRDELSFDTENLILEDNSSNFCQNETRAYNLKESFKTSEKSLSDVNNTFELSKRESQPKTEKKKLRQREDFLSNFEEKTTKYESSSYLDQHSPQISGELNLNDQNNFSNYTEDKKQKKNKKLDKNLLIVNYSMQNEHNNNSNNNLNVADERQNMKNLSAQNQNMPLINFVNNNMNNCGNCNQNNMSNSNHNNMSNSYMNQSKNIEQNTTSTMDPFSYKQLLHLQQLYINNKANMQLKNKQNLHGSDGKNVFTNDCYNNSINNIDLRTVNQMLNQDNDPNMAKLNDLLLKKSFMENVDTNNMNDQLDQQNFNNKESIRKKMGYKPFVNDQKKNNFNMWKGGYIPPNNRMQLSNLELQKERLEKSNDLGFLNQKYKEKLMENGKFDNMSWNGNATQDVYQNPCNFFSSPVQNHIPARSSDISLKLDPFSSIDDDFYHSKENKHFQYNNNNRQSVSMYGDFTKHSQDIQNNKESAFSDQISSNKKSNPNKFGVYTNVNLNNFQQKAENFTNIDQNRTINQNNNSNLFFNNRQNYDPKLSKKDNNKSNNDLCQDELMKKEYYISNLDNMKQNKQYQENKFNLEAKNDFGSKSKTYNQDENLLNIVSDTALFPGNSFSDLLKDAIDYKYLDNTDKE